MKVNYNDEVEFNFENGYLRVWVNTGSGFVTVTLTEQDVQDMLDSFTEGKDITE